MKKKLFLMLCVSMLASSMYAGVRLKPKPQPEPQGPIWGNPDIGGLTDDDTPL